MIIDAPSGFTSFPQLEHALITAIETLGQKVDVGEWQAQVGDSPMSSTIELLNTVTDLWIPDDIETLQAGVQPNLPWSELHFQERVSGIPHNPPPSHEHWPHRQSQNAEYLDEKGRFSHTYPERFWPKQAHHKEPIAVEAQDDGIIRMLPPWWAMRGIRFGYGDLKDLVGILTTRPNTRQAYLPVWFPEDLLAVTKSYRVPCSLGYHFMIRGGRLHCTYFMRSCDLLRHFRDDWYMAARLVQWIIEQGVKAQPGDLTMHIVSLHIFEGDEKLLKLRKEGKI